MNITEKEIAAVVDIAIIPELSYQYPVCEKLILIFRDKIIKYGTSLIETNINAESFIDGLATYTRDLIDNQRSPVITNRAIG